MIIAIVPSPLRFPAGTIMHGGTVNTVLPFNPSIPLDSIPMEQQKPSLNKTIGDDFILPNEGFYKVYAVLSGILVEYTMFRVAPGNGLECAQPVYIPISIKPYCTPGVNTYCIEGRTYLYLKGITLIQDMMKGVRDYKYLSISELMAYAQNLVSEFNPTMPYDPVSISVDYPEFLSDILGEIGQIGLNTPEDVCNILHMSLVTNPEITLVDKLPEDCISVYACGSRPYIAESNLMHMVDRSYQSIYANLAKEQIEHMTDSDLMRLDLSTELFPGFEFERVIGDLYCIPYTDVYLEVNMSGVAREHYFFMSHEQGKPDIRFLIPKILHDDLIYHNKTHVVRITHVTLCKTWLDELYFTVYYEDGNHQCFFMNLGAYHLYTPSLIRLHVMK